jgi:hypothetical protein
MGDLPDEFFEANGLSGDADERDLSNSTVDADASGQPDSLEADDPSVAVSQDEDGALHSGFVEDDGVTNENVDSDQAAVFNPTGTSFEPTGNTVQETIDNSDNSGGSDNSVRGVFPDEAAGMGQDQLIMLAGVGLVGLFVYRGGL